MKFGKKTQIGSLAIDENLAPSLYDEGEFGGHKATLNNIVKVFEPYISKVDGNFTCFVEKLAMDAFERFANEVYGNTKNEATGIIVGYFLHDKDNPEKKIIVATNFLQATGTASSVTCEFSYEDSIRHSHYCDANKVYPVIWIHSHPGFGVFYSSTDSSTLKNYFNCNHQMGIVVDNLQKKYLGFKIYEGEQFQQDFYVFDLQKGLDEGTLICKRYNDSNEDDNTKKKRTISFKDLSKVSPQSNSRHNSSISFQLLQKLSNQLNALEKENSVERLRTSIEELSVFLKELKNISGMPFKTSGQYSSDDIKEEITIQIKDVIQKIEANIASLRTEFHSFNSLKDDIQSLKREVTELKNSMSCSMSNNGMESRLDEIEAMLGEIAHNINYDTFDNYKFVKSFKSPLNLRDLAFCLIILGTIVFFFIKFFFLKQ